MAALKQRITDEMKAALLGGNRFRGDVLRNCKAALLNEEVALGKRDEGLSDAEIEVVLAREVKKRLESAAMYRDNGRAELAEPEEAEAAILREFLPKQLDEAELTALIQQVISDMGGASLQQMGRVIGAVKAKAGTSADGTIVAGLVKKILSE
ncbi:MAG: GatB/YqeY domain-containing protein [Candidatus Saccharibacteria bacterium]|nr:GatB/YqeY domain-containing protein [Candidatus Saccharibacteria bacterium]